MNRQLRRANEKSDQRREREQTKRKEQRQASRILRSAQARPVVTRKTDKSKDKDKTAPSAGNPPPGMVRPWVTNIYLLFLVGLILSQAFIPQPTTTTSLIIQVFFYMTLGYFLCLWLYRRGTKQPLIYSIGGGLFLALLVEGLKAVLPPLVAATPGTSTDPNLLLAALALPGLVLGSFLGQYLYRRS